MKFEYSRLDARLRWYGPEVVLRDLRVVAEDGSQTLFATREGSVGLDLWNFFRTGQFVAGRVRILEPRVTIVRLADGRIRLLGLRERPADKPPFDFDRLPAGRIVIDDATVVYRDLKAGRAALELTDLDVQLRRDRDFVVMEGAARVARRARHAGRVQRAPQGHARRARAPRRTGRGRGRRSAVGRPAGFPAGAGRAAARRSRRPARRLRPRAGPGVEPEARLRLARRGVAVAASHRTANRGRANHRPARRTRAGQQDSVPDGDQDDGRPRATALAGRGPLRDPRRRCPRATRRCSLGFPARRPAHSIRHAQCAGRDQGLGPLDRQAGVEFRAGTECRWARPGLDVATGAGAGAALVRPLGGAGAARARRNVASEGAARACRHPADVYAAGRPGQRRRAADRALAGAVGASRCSSTATTSRAAEAACRAPRVRVAAAVPRTARARARDGRRWLASRRALSGLRAPRARRSCTARAVPRWISSSVTRSPAYRRP